MFPMLLASPQQGHPSGKAAGLLCWPHRCLSHRLPGWPWASLRVDARKTDLPLSGSLDRCPEHRADGVSACSKQVPVEQPESPAEATQSLPSKPALASWPPPFPDVLVSWDAFPPPTGCLWCLKRPPARFPSLKEPPFPESFRGSLFHSTEASAPAAMVPSPRLPLSRLLAFLASSSALQAPWGGELPSGAWQGVTLCQRVGLCQWRRGVCANATVFQCLRVCTPYTESPPHCRCRVTSRRCSHGIRPLGPHHSAGVAVRVRPSAASKHDGGWSPDDLGPSKRCPKETSVLARGAALVAGLGLPPSPAPQGARTSCSGAGPMLGASQPWAEGPSQERGRQL